MPSDCPLPTSFDSQSLCLLQASSQDNELSRQIPQCPHGLSLLSSFICHALCLLQISSQDSEMGSQMLQAPPGLPLRPSHSHRATTSTSSMGQNRSGDNSRPAIQAQFLASMQRPPGLPMPPSFTFQAAASTDSISQLGSRGSAAVQVGTTASHTKHHAASHICTSLVCLMISASPFSARSHDRHTCLVHIALMFILA